MPAYANTQAPLGSPQDGRAAGPLSMAGSLATSVSVRRSDPQIFVKERFHSRSRRDVGARASHEETSNRNESDRRHDAGSPGDAFVIERSAETDQAIANTHAQGTRLDPPRLTPHAFAANFCHLGSRLAPRGYDNCASEHHGLR